MLGPHHLFLRVLQPGVSVNLSAHKSVSLIQKHESKLPGLVPSSSGPEAPGSLGALGTTSQIKTYGEQAHRKVTEQVKARRDVWACVSSAMKKST